ncbi:MAG: histidine phosphatase family protein [Verrucomicrobia bacterium]|nr:histidine phosphatase family protein [Verrucomicrobiota bacterium]
MKRLFLLFLAMGHLMATPAQIIIVRHAEKPPMGPGLSVEGQERAQALAVFFQENPFTLEFGLPTAIYAFKAITKRGKETMIPLALQLRLLVHNEYTSTQPQMIAKDILNNPLYEGKMVLICWDHSHLPLLISALRGPNIPKPPGSRYDLIYKLTYSDPSAPHFCIGLENLMKDDKKELPAKYTAYGCP